MMFGLGHIFENNQTDIFESNEDGVANYQARQVNAMSSYDYHHVTNTFIAEANHGDITITITIRLSRSDVSNQRRPSLCRSL